MQYSWVYLKNLKFRLKAKFKKVISNFLTIGLCEFFMLKNINQYYLRKREKQMRKLSRLHQYFKLWRRSQGVVSNARVIHSNAYVALGETFNFFIF